MTNSNKARIPNGRPTQCQHIKANGIRCGAHAITGSQYCFFHDPKKAKQRTAARKAGGHKSKAAVLSPETPDHQLGTLTDVVSLLGETINQVRRGEIDPRVSNAVGYLTNVLIKALEQGNLEERLNALEDTVNNQPKHTASLFDTEPQESLFSYEPQETPI